MEKIHCGMNNPWGINMMTSLTSISSTSTHLTQLEESDVDTFYKLIDQNRQYLSRWTPWITQTTDLTDILFVLQQAVNKYTRKQGLFAGIWYDNELVGCVGHQRIDKQNATGEILFWLAEAYQGQGLATRSVRSVIHYSFEKLNLHRVEIRCAVENKRAEKLAYRLGFVKEGVLRKAMCINGQMTDVAVYGLLAEEWQHSGEYHEIGSYAIVL